MNNTIDQQFIEYIVKSLVSKPDAVSIKRSIDEKGVLLELTVDPEDLGRVIGRRGSAAQALRTLLRALGTKNEARYNLKIIDVTGGERPERSADNDRPVASDAASSDDGAAQEENEDSASAIVEPSDEASTESIAQSEEDVNNDRVFADEHEEDENISNLDKTRRELADLDDLDI